MFVIPPDTISVLAATKPPASNLKLSTIGYNSVKLSFKKVNSVAGYRVYRSTKKTGGYKLIATTKSLTYTDKNLLPNTTYYYRTKTYRTKASKKVYSKFSNRVIAKTTFAKPTISQKGYEDSIVVTINKVVAGATMYRIYRSTDGKTYEVLTDTKENTYYDAKGLKTNKTYYYKVRGYRVVNNKKYFTPYSNVTLGKLTNMVLGIDVSRYQGNIDWKQVKASGIKFAIVRAGYRGYETGKIVEDPYFKANMKNAIAAGVKVGVYFYATSINEKEAIEEADWTIKAIKPYNITYPVAFDWEHWGRDRCKNVSGAQVTRNAIAFCEVVKKAGYEPIVYSSKNHYMSRYDRTLVHIDHNKTLEDYKFWLAHYTTNGVLTDYKGSYYMWQYTSSGYVPGIKGRVDMNMVTNYLHTHKYDSLSGYFPEDGYAIFKCECGLTEKRIIDTIPSTGGE